jgi:Ca-activated chloride channel family protein
MHFANSQSLHWLWLMPVSGLLLAWAFRLKRKTLREFAEDRLLSGLVSGVSVVKPMVRAILFLLFLFFALVALLRPQWGTKLETVKRIGVDILVGLDTSLSMETQDVVPSRLEKAKHEVKSLIDILRGDRVGLIVFAGTSMVNCPLTIDQNAVKLFLDVVDTQVIPRPGTNISEAIRLAIRSFGPQERHRHKVLVLVTDGESLEGNPISAAEDAKDAGILVFALGIGTGAGEPIPLRDEKGTVTGYKKDERGSVVVSRLDEATLEKIAAITGGKYFRASTGEDELQKIYDAVSQMDKQEFQSKVYLTYVDRFQIPLGIALFCILLESFISDMKAPKAGHSWLKLPSLIRSTQVR